MTAGVAVDAQKTVDEYAALEIGAHLPLDEAGHGCARRPGAFEEGLEVFTHDTVQERLLGLVTFVANGRDFDETGFGSRWNRNWRAGGRHHAMRSETPLQARDPRASPVV